MGDRFDCTVKHARHRGDCHHCPWGARREKGRAKEGRKSSNKQKQPKRGIIET